MQLVCEGGGHFHVPMHAPPPERSRPPQRRRAHFGGPDPPPDDGFLGDRLLQQAQQTAACTSLANVVLQYRYSTVD